MSRGSTAFEIFWRGSPPAETVTGVFCGSGGRTGWSNIFVDVEVSVPVSVKSALGQIACPDLESGLVPGDFLLSGFHRV